MDFTLSEQQQSIRDMVAEFATHEWLPHAAKWDETHHFPILELRKAAEEQRKITILRLKKWLHS